MGRGTTIGSVRVWLVTDLEAALVAEVQPVDCGRGVLRQRDRVDEVAQAHTCAAGGHRLVLRVTRLEIVCLLHLTDRARQRASRRRGQRRRVRPVTVPGYIDPRVDSFWSLLCAY